MIVDLTENVLATQNNEVSDTENVLAAQNDGVSDWDRWIAGDTWRKWVKDKEKFSYNAYPDLTTATATAIVEDALSGARMRKVLKICVCRKIRFEVAELIDAWEKRQEGWELTAYHIVKLDRAQWQVRKDQ